MSSEQSKTHPPQSASSASHGSNTPQYRRTGPRHHRACGASKLGVVPGFRDLEPRTRRRQNEERRLRWVLYQARRQRTPLKAHGVLCRVSRTCRVQRRLSARSPMQLFLAARGVERRRKRARWCALRDLPVAHATEALRLSSRGSGHVARRHRWSHPAVGPRQLAPVTLPGVQRVARQGEPGTEAPPLRPRAGRTLRPSTSRMGVSFALSSRGAFCFDSAPSKASDRTASERAFRARSPEDTTGMMARTVRCASRCPGRA